MSQASRDLQSEVDAFIAKAGEMTAAAVAFMGETPNEQAAGNIRRMTTACAALMTAFERASSWAMQAAMRPPGGS